MYPTVHGIIHNFKAMPPKAQITESGKIKVVEGHAQLPILLQRIESSLFIDCIFADCIKQRLSALPKHDSSYFTAKSRKKAIEIMTKHLDKHLINYNLKD